MVSEAGISMDIVLPSGDVNRKMEVFYNPVMKSNRDISVLVLRWLISGFARKVRVALPLSGSGIRCLRFLKEVKKTGIAGIFVNDKREGFVDSFNALASRNEIGLSWKNGEVEVSSKDASEFLLGQEHFDYIEIDAFGSPNPFLAAAIARINRFGILAVTATDTAALTGAYLGACRRKYWGEPMHNYLMHEVGIRLLIRKVQLLGAQFDKALVPVLSYHKEHYYRVFFKCVKGKTKVDALLKEHKYVLFDKKSMEWKFSSVNNLEGFNMVGGPVYSGALHDVSLVKYMRRVSKFESERRFLDFVFSEAKFESLNGGSLFYDLHELCSAFKVKQVPSFDSFLKLVSGVRVQFGKAGFKSGMSVGEIVEKLGL